MGLPRPPGSPITLSATAWGAYLARTHPLVPYGRRRPGKTPVRTALSPRYLIRMRSRRLRAGTPAVGQLPAPRRTSAVQVDGWGVAAGPIAGQPGTGGRGWP